MSLLTDWKKNEARCGLKKKRALFFKALLYELNARKIKHKFSVETKDQQSVYDFPQVFRLCLNTFTPIILYFKCT